MSVEAFDDITLSESLVALGGWSHSLEDTIKASESHRKVVQEMLLDVYLQDVDADLEMASYLPTLQLVSQLYGTQTGYWTESYAEFIQNPSAVLTFSWKFFDGGQARMRAESYRKLSKSAYQTYLDTINQVKETAESGYSQVNVGRNILLASSDQVKQASISLRLQSDRYQIGYGTVTDLVQAQTTLAQAVLSYINQLQDYNKSLLELARNTGLSINQDPELIDRIGDPLASLNDLSFSANL
jgi:outer membrane protein TolC